MKHLKIYEESKNEYRIGEFIILTEFDSMYLTPNFEVGDKYKIYDIDRTDTDHTYCIIDANEVKGWVTKDQIRKLETWEIDQNKFNL